jgi:hypothetical protein
VDDVRGDWEEGYWLRLEAADPSQKLDARAMAIIWTLANSS